jgi:putative PIG3 family NAD(P)H quinone oxidoreductase
VKAIQIEGDRLIWADAQAPAMGAGEVTIAVHASAINRADLVQRGGGYPPPPGASPILGLECAGEVAAVGEGVNRVAVGDRVCALLSGGGYAEEVVVPAGQVLRIPGELTMSEAAALPEVFATAYLNLYMEAGLARGERAVIHAGASGVGTAAIQLCRELGNPCFVTLGSRAKLATCLELGADAGFVRHDGSFLEACREWASDGVDVILDPVGGQYLEDNLNALAVDGRLVLIGLMGGAATQINLAMLLMKRIRVIGSTLRARSVAAKSAVMDQLEAVVWPLIADGRIVPIIDSRFPISECDAAHQHVAGNTTTGKVILEVVQ